MRHNGGDHRQTATVLFISKLCRHPRTVVTVMWFVRWIAWLWHPHYYPLTRPSSFAASHVLFGAPYNKPPISSDHVRILLKSDGAPLGCCQLPDHLSSSCSPSSSSGVVMVGTNNPRMVFIRLICPYLFALAKCLQFQVNKKSHL